LILQISLANAQTFKFECLAPTKAVQVVEIDVKAQMARLWAKPLPDITRGPFGPFEARIAQDQIVFREAKTVGRATTMTTYTLIRKTQSLRIRIEYNWDQYPW